MKFKTNAKCGGCSAAIINALSSLAPADQWDVDLASPFRTLTYKGSAAIDPSRVEALARQAGFQIEPLD